ncbi:MAG: hypothetical protein IJN03_01885 [Bacilli bacterium]|nr:hypothetical protein [Bacilli bacterium]
MEFSETKNQINYTDLIDINKIKLMYFLIRKHTKNKDKLFKFELFFSSNLTNVYNLLETRTYKHSKYNIFLITKPKKRIIMSECMVDKVVNHLISKYVLFPLIEPQLINTNVATRKNKGTKEAINYLLKYVNKLKNKNQKIYALKCDIEKFFYSIDHEILLDKLKSLIADQEIYALIKNMIKSTDEDYVNNIIYNTIIKQKKAVMNMKISNNEKKLKISELNNIPYYVKGKGLPIGNMTSQILAIYYLNDLDHFIKEKLHAKYYIRYMDDLVIIDPNKDFLRKCIVAIEEEVKKYKLKINNKTQIYDLESGLPFLGYKFLLKNKRLHILLSAKTKKRIKKRLKKANKNNEDCLEIIKNYNGYLNIADSKSFKASLTETYN